MGEYFHVMVGETEIAWGKNYVDPDLLIPFHRKDLKLSNPNSRRPFVRLETSAKVFATRLDILGFTMRGARMAYDKGRELNPIDPVSYFPDAGYEWPPSLEEWQKTVFRFAREYKSDDHKNLWSWRQVWAWEHTYLGFPGSGLWHVVRALLDACPSNEKVKVDFSHLASGGYLAWNGCDLPLSIREPVIILTEGRSDARILQSTFECLWPEYSDFFRFIDYGSAKASGGTAEVVRFVKMFIAAGIKNRVVVLFDNDAAGHQALGELGNVPDNVFPMCLPRMKWFSSYPTIGPDGPSKSNIDGRAGAIEMYLGKDVLRDERGALRPVKWTGFNEKLQRYQGEISEKGNVQSQFEAKIKNVAANPQSRLKYDFSGLQAIIDTIIRELASR